MKEGLTSSRREFLGGLTLAGAGAFLTGCATRSTAGRGVLSAPQGRAVADELRAQVASGLIAGGVCATRGGRVWHDGLMRFDPPVPMRANAEGEMARAGEYMFQVTNDDLGHCYKRLCDLIDALSGRM